MKRRKDPVAVSFPSGQDISSFRGGTRALGHAEIALFQHLEPLGSWETCNLEGQGLEPAIERCQRGWGGDQQLLLAESFTLVSCEERI